MPRARRPLTEVEQATRCLYCRALPGERCTGPDGSLYAGGVHAARARAAGQREPGMAYEVALCAGCLHPGGQHVLGGGCRLCRDCPGWDDARAVPGTWSDRMTAELLAAIEGGSRGDA